jgi:2,3-bisphosphoglycerate-independent phosphoglycerate mutase
MPLRDSRAEPLALAGNGTGPAGPVVLLILDGVGEGRGDEFDAVAAAHTPVLDGLRWSDLFRTLRAHGTAVGLPSDSDMGNSEVGHNALGAGRVFDQGAKRIDNAMTSGAIWGQTWREVVAQLTEHRAALHLVGLLSDGNVHSSVCHLYSLVDRAAQEGIERVCVHALLDGRDVPDRTADTYVRELEQHLRGVEQRYGYRYVLASGGGRMVTTMDRYGADWSVVERGWQAHVLGTAEPFSSAAEAIASFRQRNPGGSDQLIPAFTVCDSAGRALAPIQDGDTIITFNFRGDRIMQLVEAFSRKDFDKFDRIRVPRVLLAGMTLYDSDLGVPDKYLVDFEQIPGTVSEYLADTAVRQFACAETQKFGHVTYFWNGNRSGKFDEECEKYVEIPSDRVAFNERPWMKSVETADEVVRAIEAGSYDFIRANFAGGDMVGHTGDFNATRLSLEAIDLAIGRILKSVTSARGCLVVTADHGNAEDMAERTKDGQVKWEEDGEPKWKTAHSVNRVPFSIVEAAGRRFALAPGLDQAGLANVAATLIQLLGFQPPAEFEPSLITTAD